ncbi:transporter [Bacteroidia bacterium]|nr:transporter [Bacteroidia bacterium]
MKRNIALLFATFFLATGTGVQAQGNPEAWTLRDCINYALEHNIQVKKSRVNLLSGGEDTQQARARLFPSLSASISQNVALYPSPDAASGSSYNGNYGLNASWTLFDAGRRANAVKQQEIQDEINSLGIEQSENDIQLSLVQAYMQALYAYEAVHISENTAEVSKAQLDRAAGLLAAGAISRVDYAQLESQYSTNKYQLVVSQKNLDNYKLQLKQLLELDMATDMQIAVPGLEDSEVLQSLPDKASVYAATLGAMPEVKSGELGINMAKLEIERARAGYYPSLALTAGAGTTHASGMGLELGSQVWNRLNGSAGLTLSIPIYSNRDNKTAVNKAKHSVVTQQLNLQGTQKALLRTVEGVYLDAASSQNQYQAAGERLKYVSESYRLTEEQFFLGMKNTLELLTEKNNLLNAQQETLQSKYMAVMSIQLLNIYQKKPISITF